MVLSTARVRRTSLHCRLMFGFVEALEDDQILGRVGVRALNSKGFLEWLQHADSPPARNIECVQTDKAGH